MKSKDFHFKALFAFILIFSLIAWSFKVGKVFADDLSSLSDLMTRIKIATASSHDITFTLGGSTALDPSETVAIDFDEDGGGFTVDGASTVVADLDFNDGTERNIVDVDGDCTGHSGANDIVASVNDTTGVLTFEACGSFTPSSAGATINVEYGTAASGGTNRVTNPGIPQNYIIDITAAGDTGKIAVDIELEDQISVTASVDPSITFTVETMTMALGTLSTGSVSSAGPNVTTIGTNSSNGYGIYVYDVGDGGGNPGLWNATASYLIASATADLDSTAGYGFQCSKNSGDGACRAPYNGSGNNVGGLLTTATVFADYSSKPSGTDSFNMYTKAKAAAADEAGNYADTLTIIATAIF